MGTTDSKEASQENSRDHSQSWTGAHSTPNSKFEEGKSPRGQKYSYRDYEEDKCAANTQVSGDGEYDYSNKIGSGRSTPHKDPTYRREIFTGMTRRVLNNKEKHLAQRETNKENQFYNKSTKDPDGIEWIKKEEIVGSRMVSSRPYGTKNPRNKLFGPGSDGNSKSFKFSSGVLTYLPPKALMTILSYDMTSYRKFMSVWASWHVNIKEAFDQHFNQVENDFVLKYHENLLFTESYTSSANIKFCGKRGLRVDRVLVCDVLRSKPQLNKTLTVGYWFNYYGEPKHKRFKAEYRIDVVKNKKRLVWMHIDEDTGCSYQQTIFQVWPDDKIEFALSFFSLRGLVDLESIIWSDPQIYDTPKITTLTYNKDMMNIATDDRAIKIYADINRVWELEDSVVEWYEQKYYENQSEILDFSFLKTMFDIDTVEYSGVDNKVVRIQARARSVGYLDPSWFKLGIRIRNQKSPIRNEVKRKGILSERDRDIELRVGDTFIIYLTRKSDTTK